MQRGRGELKGSPTFADTAALWASEPLPRDGLLITLGVVQHHGFERKLAIITGQDHSCQDLPRQVARRTHGSRE